MVSTVTDRCLWSQELHWTNLLRGFSTINIDGTFILWHKYLISWGLTSENHIIRENWSVWSPVPISTSAVTLHWTRWGIHWLSHFSMKSGNECIGKSPPGTPIFPSIRPSYDTFISYQINTPYILFVVKTPLANMLYWSLWKKVFWSTKFH